MQVKDIMKDPFIIDKDIDLIDAAKIMSSKGIHSMLFVERSKARGIITESDLLKNFGKHKRVSQIMSKNIITVFPEKTIEEALLVMKENKVKQLPVVDKKKQLVGTVSMTDIAANVDKLEGDFFFN
ncbi:MAG: CBS domain-containing protein [Nanoarchaeota archaeon]